MASTHVMTWGWFISSVLSTNCLTEEPTQQMLFQYLFDDKLGNLPTIYKITVDHAVIPIVRAPHRVPHGMQKKIHTKLKRMVSIGVIAEAGEPSDWVSMTTKKNKEELRFCINPNDLNTAIKRPCTLR